MGNALYDKGRQAFLEGSVAWLTDSIKAVLVDLSLYALVITAASNASPIQITTSAAHGLATGDRVSITGVVGNTAANGVWTVTALSGTTFTLNSSAGNGAWTSGGYVVKLSGNQFLSDIPGGARASTCAAFTSKTSTWGVADADDITFTAVPAGNPCQAIVIYKDTGAAGTSPLIAYLDAMTNLPVTPNGGNIIAQWNNGPERIFKL